MIFNPILPIYIIIILAISILAVGVICIIKKKYRNFSSLRRILILVFLLITLLRPSFAGGESQQASIDVTLYFIIDNTNSMYVEDANGKTRMSALKKDVTKIIQSFPGAHYSIYTQDTMSYVMLPVTTDLSAAMSGIDSLNAKDTRKSVGSDLNDLIVFAQEGIKNYDKKHPESQSIVIFMSDGETTTESADAVKFGNFDTASTGVVIGYGSIDGGKVPNISKDADSTTEAQGYLVCNSGELCISKINEDYLKKIASNCGFKYVHSENGIDASLVEDFKNIAKSKVKVSSNRSAASYVELYWIFALVVLILLLCEFASCFNAILAEYEVKNK